MCAVGPTGLVLASCCSSVLRAEQQRQWSEQAVVTLVVIALLCRVSFKATFQLPVHQRRICCCCCCHCHSDPLSVCSGAQVIVGKLQVNSIRYFKILFRNTEEAYQSPPLFEVFLFLFLFIIIWNDNDNDGSSPQWSRVVQRRRRWREVNCNQPMVQSLFDKKNRNVFTSCLKVCLKAWLLSNRLLSNRSEHSKDAKQQQWKIQRFDVECNLCEIFEFFPDCSRSVIWTIMCSNGFSNNPMGKTHVSCFSLFLVVSLLLITLL